MSVVRKVCLAMLTTTLSVAWPSSVGGSETMRVAIRLVTAEHPDQSVESAQRGSVAAYSRYRGAVTTWARGINVDDQHFFDERDASGAPAIRRTSLTLDLPEGMHVVQPGGHRFRIMEGRIESLSPHLFVQADQLSLRLYPGCWIYR